jgi:voltage-gated potassium channel
VTGQADVANGQPMASTEPPPAPVPFDLLTHYQRRRLVTRAVVRTIATVAGVVAIYFLLPMDRPMNPVTVAELVLGAAVLIAIIGLQIWRITQSAYPGIRAVEALAFTIPVFFFLFATAYYLTNHSTPASFGTPLTRTDAMYFSSTVFTTVGFGDITAKTETARILTTIQMWIDLLIVGLVVRLGVNAVKYSQQRHAAVALSQAPNPQSETHDSPMT